MTRGQEAATHGKKVGHEADVEAELLRDLGRVAMLADRVRHEVLEHRPRRATSREAFVPRTQNARLRVDDRPLEPAGQQPSASSAAVA